MAYPMKVFVIEGDHGVYFVRDKPGGKTLAYNRDKKAIRVLFPKAVKLTYSGEEPF